MPYELTVIYFCVSYVFLAIMSEGERSITIKDIAREFGVTAATVSRALRDSPRISKGLRDRIHAYARSHNFRVNMFASSLRQRRVLKIIGVVLPELTHYYFSSVLSGIEEESRGRGYSLLVGSSGEESCREKELCKMFYRNEVCGVIVSEAKGTTDYSHFLELQSSGVPLVFYDRICTGVDASRVVVDDYAGAYSAVEYLIRTGCRRIAYYGSPITLEISKNRYNGWRDALLRHKIDVRYCVYRECDSMEMAERMTEEVMCNRPHPDAFFAVNDETAIGIMHSVKKLGYRVPEDVSVCGFTNGLSALCCDPKLTTVDQDGREVGRQAARILIDKAERRQPIGKTERRVVKTKLVIRGSTRPVTGRPVTDKPQALMERENE